ncbi:MAG TPA: MFS transporter [Pseudolabrys sp.]|nr:MFS transporter [Pseudolabrys sp.]
MTLVVPFRFGFATRLAAFYAAYFVLGGMQMPFLPVWLKAKGLDARVIGIMLAVPLVVRVLAIPLIAREADRRDALRPVLVLTTAATVVGYAAFGLSSGAAALLVAFTLASLAYTPIMPLAETYALRGLAARGRAYGPVRLWGSLAFIVGSFLAGFAADRIDGRDLIWPIVTATAAVALAAFALEPLKLADLRTPAQPAVRRGLWREPPFAAAVAAAALIQASHAMFYGFSALEWGRLGLDGREVAALWALGVVAEIVLFALQGRLPALFEPTMLMMIGAGGAVVRWVGMALGPPPALLPFLQLLHAASFGATHLGALTFIARHAPAGQAASAQGWLAIALGLAMAASMAVSGWLYASFGVAAYGAMALAAIVGGGCASVAHRTRHITMP